MIFKWVLFAILRRIQNPVKHLRWSFLQSGFELRCLAGFWIRLWDKHYFLDYYYQWHYLLQSFNQDFNPLTAYVPHLVEASQLICNLTGFYMMGIIGR